MIVADIFFSSTFSFSLMSLNLLLSSSSFFHMAFSFSFLFSAFFLKLSVPFSIVHHSCCFTFLVFLVLHLLYLFLFFIVELVEFQQWVLFTFLLNSVLCEFIVFGLFHQQLLLHNLLVPIGLKQYLEMTFHIYSSLFRHCEDL